MCLSTALSSKTQESFPLSSHIPFVSHSFLQHGRKITFSSEARKLWNRQIPMKQPPGKCSIIPQEKDNKQLTTLYIMQLFPPLKARQSILCHILSSHEIFRTRNCSVFFPGDMSLLPYEVKWPLQIQRESKASQIRGVSRKSQKLI